LAGIARNKLCWHRFTDNFINCDADAGAAKRRVAVQIKSRALEADSKQTDLCVYLSAILLGGLILNAAFGWWWADPVAALVMIPIIVNEGIEGLQGEACCDEGACH
jgi:divalent metal cation (Fe/Co/Zn/Cd) transporter